jgi:hypothetical protein
MKKLATVKEETPKRRRPYIKKIRTPLGELIRWAEYNYLGFDPQAAKVINKAKELLEKEKQIIIHGIDNHTASTTRKGKTLVRRLTGEKYYKRTFKNKDL